MKISKNSWHFKLINFFKDDYAFKVRQNQISDCQHIRNVFGFSLLTLVIIGFISLITFILFVGYIALPLWYIFGVEFFNLTKEAGGIFGDTLPLAVIVDVLTVGLGGCFLVKTGYRKWKANRPEPVEKPDGVIKTFFKSQNEKICSRVEFVEGEK